MKCDQIIEKRALKHIPRTKYDISFWLAMVAKVFIPQRAFKVTLCIIKSDPIFKKSTFPHN